MKRILHTYATGLMRWMQVGLSITQLSQHKSLDMKNSIHNHVHHFHFYELISKEYSAQKQALMEILVMIGVIE